MAIYLPNVERMECSSWKCDFYITLLLVGLTSNKFKYLQEIYPALDSEDDKRLSVACAMMYKDTLTSWAFRDLYETDSTGDAAFGFWQYASLMDCLDQFPCVEDLYIDQSQPKNVVIDLDEIVEKCKTLKTLELEYIDNHLEDSSQSPSITQ